MKQLLIIKNLIKVLIVVFCVLVFKKDIFAGWVSSGTDYMYVDDRTGQYVVNNWIQTAQGYYFMNSNGKMSTGFVEINGNYYYFAQNGIMQVGFVKVNNFTYYFNPENGQMVRGWIQVNNNGIVDYYYFKENGTMAEGFTQIGTAWYYFNEGKAIINSWAQINGNWYKFLQNGEMAIGWYAENGKYHYLNPLNGQMVTGFIKDDQGYYYYLESNSGVLVLSQTINVGGTQYTFNEKGQLVNNMQGYQTNQQYNNQINPYPQSTGVQNIVNNLGGLNQQNTGVSIGVGPNSGMIQQSNVYGSGVVTSNQQNIINNSPLTVGSTIGPR